jgi:hypothetical protein
LRRKGEDGGDDGEHEERTETGPAAGQSRRGATVGGWEQGRLGEWIGPRRVGLHTCGCTPGPSPFR